MAQYNVFFLFPESEEEIKSLADCNQIISGISEIRSWFKKVDQKYVFFYNECNIRNFIDNAKRCNINNSCNLDKVCRSILSKASVNVSQCNSISCKSQYYELNLLSDCQTVAINELLKKELFENSFKHDGEIALVNFSTTLVDKCSIIKYNKCDAELPILQNVNLYTKAFKFIEILESQWKQRPFSLEDMSRFERTNKIYKKDGSSQKVYKEKGTNRYWYFDYFHRDSDPHYEVFDAQGKHLGESVSGESPTYPDPSKSIKNLLH